ncbi:MAG: hypothetical protein ACKVJT_02055 [Alphaproteobacteria bacterium]|jgi:uncharacterized FlaG/YvyC family protein
MQTIERVKLPHEPPPRAPEPSARRKLADQPDNKITPRDRLGTLQIRAVEHESRIFQARLNYDHDSAKVYVEILDPVTGEVLRTLPADRAADEQSDLRQGGALLDQLA